MKLKNVEVETRESTSLVSKMAEIVSHVSARIDRQGDHMKKGNGMAITSLAIQF